MIPHCDFGEEVVDEASNLAPPKDGTTFMQHPNRIPCEKDCPRQVIGYAANFQNEGLWEIKKGKHCVEEKDKLLFLKPFCTISNKPHYEIFFYAIPISVTVSKI